MLPCGLDLVSLRSSPSPKCVLLGIISPDLSRLNRDLFSATWRCHGTDVPISRTDSRGTVERYFWQRSGDHCGHRRAFQGRSLDRADFRMYSNFESLSYTCLPYTDTRFYFIKYSLDFGLLVPRWYVVVSVPRTCALTRGAPQVACSNTRANLV